MGEWDSTRLAVLRFPEVFAGFPAGLGRSLGGRRARRAEK